MPVNIPRGPTNGPGSGDNQSRGRHPCPARQRAALAPAQRGRPTRSSPATRDQSPRQLPRLSRRDRIVGVKLEDHNLALNRPVSLLNTGDVHLNIAGAGQVPAASDNPAPALEMALST